MTTRLLYLEDFDVVTATATVIVAQPTEDGRIDVVLDQTCFYPRGGGQDWDTGTIDDFIVTEVRLDADGVVHHIGEGRLAIGQTVNCLVDKARRTINTRLHSAGHVLDIAMSDLQSDWIPSKGAHYPHMSFVEYQVPSHSEVPENLITIVQEKVNTLSVSDYVNKLLFVDKADLVKYCRHVPENLPTNKPTRIVLYADDFGIPCGGTHVNQVSKIGDITVTKIKVKKGIAKLSYSIAIRV